MKYGAIMTRTWVCMLLIVLQLSISGCGESVAPGRGVAVSGTVTMGGKPLEGASVTFMNDTFVGYGKTDAEGVYRLVQGALPGTNKVTISKFDGEEPVQVEAADGMDAGQAEAAALGNEGMIVQSGPKDLIPPEFSDPSRTKLTFEVPADGASGADFNL